MAEDTRGYLVASPQPCRLVDTTGQLISAGQCLVVPDGIGGWQAQVVALDQPGTFVQRCLLGSVTTLVLERGDGYRTAALVLQAGFDGAHGRTCRLALTSPPPRPERWPTSVTGLQHQ